MVLEPPTWNFTEANKATLEMFKAKNVSEFTSKKPFEISPKTQPDGKKSMQKALDMINIAVKKGFNQFEWRHMRLDGEEFPATVTLIAMNVGGKRVLLAKVRDDTKIKETEVKLGELRRLKSDLSM